MTMTARTKPETRHEFVALMFAVAVAEAATKVADLAQYGHVSGFLPAYAHLALSAVLIAASWVGWSRSRAPGGVADVEDVFRRNFIVLLLDVVIVTEYFVIVRAADFTIDLKSHSLVCRPSAAFETWGLAVVFFTYAVWDVAAQRQYLESIVCMVLALVSGWTFARQTDSARVVCADAALIALTLFFRAIQLKTSAGAIATPAPQKSTAVADGVKDHTPKGKIGICVSLMLLWIVFGALARYLPSGLLPVGQQPAIHEQPESKLLGMIPRQRCEFTTAMGVS